MSVLGIDIGTSFCVLATIQRGAIGIIRNDLSERLTPSLVAFTEKERLIGEEAQSQMRSNFLNTCRYIKQLLGGSPTDIEDFERENSFKLAELGFGSGEEDGQAGYFVSYKKNDMFFSATRIMAALLTKLKLIAEKSTGSPVYDVVIGVPGWFSDRARQAMIDAATIAGLRCLRAMNEHAAVALDYGIFRSNTFEADQMCRVAFIGIGHGTTTVSIVEFSQRKLQILGVACDKRFGGRDIDLAIVRYFATSFFERYGVDPLATQKSLLKMEETASKAKKILSANIEAPFNIECLVDEYDISELLTREQFEELCAPFRERLFSIIESAFVNNKVNPESIQQVELIGGCSRIPCFQKTISEFFKDRLPLSKTLSMDETVARGCALQAAMLNPRYRVREFTVVDRALENIEVAWPVSQDANGSNDTFKKSVLFEKGCPLGSTKWLTFQRDSAIELRVIPESSTEPLIAHIEPPQNPNVDRKAAKRIKVKALLSHHGVTSFEEAHLLVDEEYEDIVKEKSTTEAPNAPPSSSSAAAPSEKAPGSEDPPAETTEVVKNKIRTKRFNCQLDILPRKGYLSNENKVLLAKSEESMAQSDFIQQRTKEAQNELEAYVYDLRDKLVSEYSAFVNPNTAQELPTMLDAVEGWIYDNPDTTREECEEKLAMLQKHANPIIHRCLEYHGRHVAYKNIEQLIERLRTSASSPEFAHVDPFKLRSLHTKLDDVQKWVTQVKNSHAELNLYEDPVVLCSILEQELESLESFSRTILTENENTPIASDTNASGTHEMKYQDQSTEGQEPQNHNQENMESN